MKIFRIVAWGLFLLASVAGKAQILTTAHNFDVLINSTNTNGVKVTSPLLTTNADESNTITAQARADFEWISSLGFPDPKGCPYVRVATGNWTHRGYQRPENHFVNGFLLATNAQTFTALTLGLIEKTFTATNCLGGEYANVGYTPLSLAREVAGQLHILRNLSATPEPFTKISDQILGRTDVAILAWACWRNGLNAEAQQLYDEARKLPSREAKAGFRENLELELGYLMMWRAVANFGDTSFTRPQLLGQFEAVIKNYPHSEYHERAKQTAGLLRRMISEDEAHAKLGVTDLDLLSVEDRVHELIFRLRDQNGHQWSQPGCCNIFDDDPGMQENGSTNSPAHQLVKLGYAAVPQLIAALDDATFSRSVEFHRDFFFSHDVLTVGRCAKEILKRITGTDFGSGAPALKDGEKSATRLKAETWWTEFQKKGEQQMLIEALASPGSDAPEQAELLRLHYPAIAAATVVRAAQTTTDSWLRSALIIEVARLNVPEATGFLRHEMSASAELESRVSAAYGLFQREREEAVQGMVLEWKHLASQEHQETDAEAVIGFLASSGSLKAIRALGQNLRERPVNVRLEVIEGLANTNAYNGFSLAFNDNITNSPATINAIEECLINELEDTDGGDRRVCDQAAYALATRWPARYVFNITDSRRIRDLRRIECANVWRHAHNLPALALPQTSATHVPPEQAAQVTTVKWQDSGVKPETNLVSAVDAFRGRPLTGKKLATLLADFVAKPNPNASGIEIQAIKDEDFTGVHLEIHLLPGVSAAKPSNWAFFENIKLGRESILEAGGTLGAYSTITSWDDLQMAVATAVAAAPETPFEIGVRVYMTKSN